MTTKTNQRDKVEMWGERPSKGSGKANRLRKQRGKKSFKEGESTEKNWPASQDRAAEARRGRCYLTWKGGSVSYYFSDIIFMIFSTPAFVFWESKKPPFLAMPLFLALLKTYFPPLPSSLL